MKVLVTGGAGFIGSALVRHLVLERGIEVCTLDKLTYSGRLENLESVAGHPAHRFEQMDICDFESVRALLLDYRPDAVMHLAAESHVDRSIDGPGAFVQTNVVGTYSLLQAARELNENVPDFRFLHVSTDEVYGTLGAEGAFTEDTPYAPNSPYSASKAGSDHLARAWFHTYGLPVLITNCTNNYGPYQFPEKLIPMVIMRAVAGREIPVYGDGLQVRDWLFVEDHVTGLWEVLQRGTPGRAYNLGGECELTNLEVVHTLLDVVARRSGRDANDARELIRFVKDRPGHDRRYAMDLNRIRSELDWSPGTSFEAGVDRTVAWYLSNEDWCLRVSAVYQGQRLGLRTRDEE